jgi:putative transposase
MMTNHVHLLASADQPETLSRVIQRLGRRYVSYFNFLYERTGTPWEGRFRSTLVGEERYLLMVTPHLLIEDLAEDAAARHHAYRELFEELLSAEDLRQIRDSLNKGWAYGSPEFVKRLGAQGARRPAPLPMGRPRKKVPELT